MHARRTARAALLRTEASSAAEVANVNDLVDTFKVHPAAVATVLSVFHEVSADDAIALTSGNPPSPELRQLLLRCLKAMVDDGALAIAGSPVAPADLPQLQRRRRVLPRRRALPKRRPLAPPWPL